MITDYVGEKTNNFVYGAYILEQNVLRQASATFSSYRGSQQRHEMGNLWPRDSHFAEDQSAYTVARGVCLSYQAQVLSKPKSKCKMIITYIL